MTQADATSSRLLAVIVVALSVLAGFQIWGLLRVEPVGMDFLPLWTAGRMAWSEPGKVYDFAAITAAQGWLPQPHFSWSRPYVYPPTTLLLLAPLGRLPYWAALGAWLAVSLCAFLYASARLAPRSATLTPALAAVLPAVVVAVTAGQTVVLATALVVLAVLDLERRPRVAGALLALAAMVKPEAVIMAPVALLASGALEALICAGLVAGTAMAASATLFGPVRWSEWLASLPAFQRVVDSIPGLGPAMITPFSIARELGSPEVFAVSAATVFALASAWLIWIVFRRRGDPVRRAGALTVGSLLAAPYALCFDATLIVPAAAALAAGALAQGQKTIALLTLGAAFEISAPNLGLPALLLFAGLILLSPPAPTPAASSQRQPNGAASRPSTQRQRLPA